MKNKEIKKEDFEVYDYLSKHGGAYKPMKDGRWYNHEMYEDALIKAGLYNPNWFKKLPNHWRYLCYLIAGIIIGYFINYVYYL